MKKIGLIAGIGPESTIIYYQHIYRQFQKTSGTDQNPELLMYSINMWEMAPFMEAKDWDGLTDFFAAKISQLEKHEIDYVALAANTPHVIQNELLNKINTPFISIVEETCKRVKESNNSKVALFGTQITLDSGIYASESRKHGFQIILPTQSEQTYINDKYFKELMFNDIRKKTKDTLLEIVSRLKKENHIDGLILGGTELSLILSQTDIANLTVFDSTEIHAQSFIKRMLEH